MNLFHFLAELALEPLAEGSCLSHSELHERPRVKRPLQQADLAQQLTRLGADEQNWFVLMFAAEKRPLVRVLCIDQRFFVKEAESRRFFANLTLNGGQVNNICFGWQTGYDTLSADLVLARQLQ